jgi:hypothetical protein
MTTIGGCPLGVCIVNGKAVFFDLPYYIYNVFTTSTLPGTMHPTTPPKRKHPGAANIEKQKKQKPKKSRTERKCFDV